MPYPAGSRIVIKQDCEIVEARGLTGTVFAYANDGTVWITLEKPFDKRLSVRIKSEHMAGVPRPTQYQTTKRYNLHRVIK